MLKAIMHFGLLYLLSVVIVLVAMAIFYRYREPILKEDFASALWRAFWWPLVLGWHALSFLLERLLGIEDVWDRFTRRRSSLR